jgi:hypothetical protein
MKKFVFHAILHMAVLLRLSSLWARKFKYRRSSNMITMMLLHLLPLKMEQQHGPQAVNWVQAK